VLAIYSPHTTEIVSWAVKEDIELELTKVTLLRLEEGSSGVQRRSQEILPLLPRVSQNLAKLILDGVGVPVTPAYHPYR